MSTASAQAPPRPTSPREDRGPAGTTGCGPQGQLDPASLAARPQVLPRGPGGGPTPPDGLIPSGTLHTVASARKQGEKRVLKGNLVVSVPYSLTTGTQPTLARGPPFHETKGKKPLTCQHGGLGNGRRRRVHGVKGVLCKNRHPIACLPEHSRPFLPRGMRFSLVRLLTRHQGHQIGVSAQGSGTSRPAGKVQERPTEERTEEVCPTRRTLLPSPTRRRASWYHTQR